MKPEQLTAWALNELSHEEKAQIESLLKEDNDVQAQAAQTKTFCDFLSTELGDDSLEFTPEQRERLWSADEPSAVNASKPSASAPAKQTSFWRRHALVNLAAAAAVVVGTTVLLRRETEETVQRENILLTGKLTESKKQPSKDQDGSLLSRAAPVPPAEPVASLPTPSVQKPDERRDVGHVSPGAYANADVIAEAPMDRERAESPARQQAKEVPVQTPAPAKPAAPRGNITAVGRLTLDTSNGYTGNTTMTAEAAATTYSGAIVGMKGPSVSLPEPGVVGDSFDYYEVPPHSNESYTQIVENALKDVMREPLSTFSIDVDTASYANVRRFLNQNTAPPRDAVRIEELINYFPTTEEGPAPGAKEPFAVEVEMAACPWQPQHRLARIAIKGRQISQDRQSSNLVFLVDVSGSMGDPNKLPLVKQSLRMLTEQLGENDRVSMVTYAGGTQVVLSPTSGQNKAEIMAAIDRLQSGGGTHGSAGIRLAYEQAVAGFIKGGVNRVILCSDGDFNVGISSPEELETYITEKARSGVFLSLLGYGTGNLKDRTMETLADKGNGNYAYIDSLSEARKVLVEQMNGTLVTIAKDVKIQVEFNPAVIRSYRLIGYENRLLAKEDFNDDTKDAGEIGAGHSVTALYELVPANLPPGADPRPMVDDLKYQQPAAAPAAPSAVIADTAESGEALTVKLRYKAPEGSVSSLIEVPLRDDKRGLETASDEFKFTTAVAGFGMLLRQSSYSGQLTWEQVRQLALEGKGTDAFGYRGEFLQLIEKARGVSR
ncbi:secreted protein with Ig-like and vWFA domain [Prosthecobacter fusiformis]|uniref:Secreted protein with Ig-like and vWFA domain n=1 Tax=Prosthecobacter fusiformis TaxID=48464 RepID=A0A4R7S3W7_9BACT|nr:VWA domain-containing protein [Prosthecobacter fusiformis]TDU73031.1 secreted protein with Ig-like and vWFA domain [Prosthecobacter fusiformis]